LNCWYKFIKYFLNFKKIQAKPFIILTVLRRSV